MTSLLSSLIRIFRWTLTGLFGLAALVYLITFAVNWRDQPPSAEALRMKSFVDERPAVADADNAFIYLMGFSAPPGLDPQHVGAVRRDWMVAVNRDPRQFNHPPDSEGQDDDEVDLPTWNLMGEQCPRDEPVKCRDLFESLAEGPPFTAAEQGYLDRYQRLLVYPAWREVIPLDLRLPLPSYPAVLRAQAMTLLNLRRHARSGASTDIRAQLHADLEYWREAQKSADTLISKMISVAALRQHFFFGNLVLRALPPQQQLVAIPEGWSRELSGEELDMHRVMAGELRYIENLLRGVIDPVQWQMLTEEPKPPGWGQKVVAALATPLYQPQDQINHVAKHYLALADRYTVPIRDYLEVRDTLASAPAPKFSWSLYNPLGQWMRTYAGLGNYWDYPPRVASVEGMRQAALLTARFRASGIAPGQIATQLSSSPLRNPFDDAAFEWDPEESAVVYDGPDDSLVKHHVYFY